MVAAFLLAALAATANADQSYLLSGSIVLTTPTAIRGSFSMQYHLLEGSQSWSLWYTTVIGVYGTAYVRCDKDAVPQPVVYTHSGPDYTCKVDEIPCDGPATYVKLGTNSSEPCSASVGDGFWVNGTDPSTGESLAFCVGIEHDNYRYLRLEAGISATSWLSMEITSSDYDDVHGGWIEKFTCPPSHNEFALLAAKDGARVGNGTLVDPSLAALVDSAITQRLRSFARIASSVRRI